MNERTDGRTDGRPAGRTDEWMDGGTDGRTDGLTNGRTDGRTHARTHAHTQARTHLGRVMDGWMDKWMDKWMDGWMERNIQHRKESAFHNCNMVSTVRLELLTNGLQKCSACCRPTARSRPFRSNFQTRTARIPKVCSMLVVRGYHLGCWMCGNVCVSCILSDECYVLNEFCNILMIK